ncbi:MAG: MurR/RpiR family transcriptional regulator [Clostridia bacterium]|nr:MurR/RpiR family transcriptional regulator [Clostridia bacterium]
MATDIAQRIRNIQTRLSKGQKKIANAVLYEYDKIAYLTAGRLGNMVGVSESTVVRFAGALGYEGYGEFQHAVQELVRTRLTLNQRIDVTKERMHRGDIIENVMTQDMNKIRRTFEHLNRDAFFGAAEAILTAKNIYVLGARSSDSLAQLLSYNLSLIYDNVRHVRPMSNAEIFEQMFTISENDVLFAFSFPRYSSKMVNAVKYAKQRGATVIVMTDSDISPIADMATHLLLAEGDMASFMDSFVAPTSIINALIIHITQKREKEIRQRFDRLEQVWSEYGVYTIK